MARSSSRMSISTTVTVGAVAVIALIASGVLRPTPVTGAAPGGSPSAPASPAPATPAPATPAPPTPAPATPAPATPAPATPEPITPGIRGPVRLDIATPHDVVLEVWDHAGVIAGVQSGRAGDGMSVRWSDVKVENLGPSTLRLTWIGFAADDDLILAVNEHDGAIVLTLAQPVPPPNSDGLGFDRVLILEFASPIDADDISSVIQEGVDTPGW